MQTLQEAEGLISSMTAGEKAQLLRWIARDFDGAFPGIESDPEVAGGESCILRTRIPVWVLVQARKLGASEADLLTNYPTLRAEDLVMPGAIIDCTEMKSINRSLRTRKINK